MTEKLRALLVDESETDAKLVIDALRAAAYDVEWERVEEAETLVAALNRGVWDIVICDWALPGFLARHALSLVRAAHADLPLIFVSGVAGEDAAVAAMHAGAQDYVFKGNLTRLVPAVGRELRESRRRAAGRKTPEALRATEARYRIAFEYSPLPQWFYDVKTLRFLEVNDAAIRHYGYSGDEFLEMTVKDIRSSDDMEEAIRTIQGTQKTSGAGPGCFGVWKHRKKDGTLIDVEISGHTVEFEGQEARVIAVHDITERLRTERSLRATEERYRLLLDSTAEAIYGIDTHGNCTFANRACARLLGYESADGLVGKHMHTLMHHTKPDGAPSAEQECRIYQAFRRGEGTHVDDEIFWRANGTSFPVEYFSYPIRQEKNLIGCVVTFLDISEKRHAERSARALAAERDRLLGRIRLQIERMPLVYILFDADFRITEWNPAAQQTFGYTREEALGKQPNDLNPPSFHAEATAIMERLRAGEMAAHSVNENLTKDGRTITCEWFNTPLRADDGRFSGLLCLGRDVTDERRLEAQLQHAQKMEAEGLRRSGEQLRALAARLQSIREEEQRRIARDLHDELGQRLTAVKIDLRALEEAAARADPANAHGAIDIAVSASALADEILAALQGIAVELRPDALDRLGLAPALRQEVQRFAERTSIAAETRFPEPAPELPPSVVTALFRIAKEALTNVIRHANAKHVVVALEVAEGRALLRIEDDGVGLAAEGLDDSAALGLLGMKERAASLGGEVRIERGREDRGTIVLASIPIARGAA